MEESVNMRLFVSVVLVCFASGALALDEVDTWTLSYSHGHRTYLKLFDEKQNFRRRFVETAETAPQVIAAWVSYLIENKDRDTKDFITQRGADTEAILQLQNNYANETRVFQEWVRDNERAALSLAKCRGFKRALDLKPVAIKKDPPPPPKKERAEGGGKK